MVLGAGRPSKVIAKAFSVGFHRIALRALALPVVQVSGGEVNALEVGLFGDRKCPRARTARWYRLQALGRIGGARYFCLDVSSPGTG